MPKYRITAPDGRKLEVTAPEGATPEDVMGFVQQQMGGTQPDPIAQQAAALDPQAAEIEQTKNTPLGEYLRSQAMQPVPGETEEQRNIRLGGQITGEERPGMVPGMARAGLQGGTFATGDEAQAAMQAAIDPLLGRGEGLDFGERYGQRVARERGRLEQFREDQPIAAYGTEMAGALPTALLPAGALGRMAQTGSTGARVAAGGTLGALQGGLYGAGAGQDTLGDRLTEAGKGAAVGGAVGAAAPLVARGVQTVAQEVADTSAMRKLARGVEKIDDWTANLKGRAQRAYKRVDQAGVQVKPERLERFRKELAMDLANDIDPVLHPKATSQLARLEEELATGKFPDYMATRRRLAAVAQSNDPDERRIGSMMVNAFDDFVDGLEADDVIAGDPRGLGQTWREARGLWKRFRNAEMIDDAFTRADLQASGVENGLRVAFRRILQNKKLARGFEPAEIEAMKKVVKGTATGNTLRRLGRMSSAGTGQQSNMLGFLLSGSLGAGAGGAVGGPAGAAVGATVLPTIGYAAQKGAESLSRRNANIVKALIAQPQAWKPQQVRNTVSGLIELAMQRNVPVTAQMRPQGGEE